MSLMKLALVAPLALSLTACAGDMVSVVAPQPPVGSYYNGDFEYATRNGAIRTVISGSPFTVEAAALNARVRELMKGQTRGRPARFVAADTDDTDPAYRVVLVFNLKPGYSGHDLCRAGAGKTPSTGPGPATVATMAFCFGDQMKTEVEGRINGVKGLDDPRFAALIRQTTLDLIPANDGHDAGSDTNRN